MSLPKDPQKREEWIRKQSEAQKARYEAGRVPWNKGKKHTPEAIARMSAAQQKDEEWRRKQSAMKKGRPNPKNSHPLTPEARARLIASHTGRPSWNKGISMTEETRARLEAGRKAKPITPEARAQAATSNRGRKRTPEQRARMKVAQQDKVITPEQRAKMNAAKKAAQEGKPGPRTDIPHSPETRKRLSQIARQRWEDMSEEQKAARIEALRASTKDITKSALEEVIAAELDAQGIVYERQKRIGWYRVDFYIPATNTCIEAQGCYWHACEECGHEGRKEKRIADTKRHEYLRRKGYAVEIIWEHERRFELQRFRRLNGGSDGSG